MNNFELTEHLKAMDLHQVMTTPDGTHILRVLEGWIYTKYHLNQFQNQEGFYQEFWIPSSVFVPMPTNYKF